METIHLVQRTHFIDRKTEVPRGEGVFLLALFWVTPEWFSFKAPRKGALVV